MSALVFIISIVITWGLFVLFLVGVIGIVLMMALQLLVVGAYFILLIFLAIP